MTRTVSVAERRTRLARRHLLAPDGRVDDPATIADAVVALHSSDPVTVHLTAAARMRTPSIAAVEDALYERRSLIRHHAMRRTLWVATPGTVRVMHAAATGKVAATEHRRAVRMLEDSGIADGEAWLAAAKIEVLAVLHSDGPMTARELGRRVPALAHPITLAPGKRYQATAAAHTRVLLVLGFEGALVRTRPVGSWISGQYTWAATDSWLPGGLDGPEVTTACRDLAAAYLARFGPVTSADVQWWTGWTQATTRRALSDAGAAEVKVDGGAAWVAPGDDDPVEPAQPWVALLPSLDPTVMGWKQRAWYLPAEAADAFDRNGNAGPTIWVDGQVAGVWAHARSGEVHLHWFSGVPAARRRAVQRRAEELQAWVGESRFSVRFPSPAHDRLLAEVDGG